MDELTETQFPPPTSIALLVVLPLVFDWYFLKLELINESFIQRQEEF